MVLSQMPGHVNAPVTNGAYAGCKLQGNGQRAKGMTDGLLGL